MRLNPILSSLDLTVASEYKPLASLRNSYQSEEDLERELIRQLQGLSYEYVTIKSPKELRKNLRSQIEALNSFVFSDEDWEIFLQAHISRPSSGIVEKTALLQGEDPVIDYKTLKGDLVNIKLFDKNDIHKNRLQVMNQYSPDTGKRKNRYDVTILVNGLPLVHIELKRRGVAIREAFNQINRYGRESFWSDDTLFEFVQIFVISNGTNTMYYSNTTRMSHVSERAVTKGTFEFTSYWADLNNNPITDLVDFANTFLSKRVLLNVLSRYCVLDSNNTLLVMRPYQIAATEKVIERVTYALNNGLLGKTEAGGYIYHTTGSGKTLTSFKTSQLLTYLNTGNDRIEKVLFVVDRKDLDYQTRKEYNRFSEGSASYNKNTKELAALISNPEKRIIVTTIQKLSNYIKANQRADFYNKNIAIIFDECHRSQFGEMHSLIRKSFKRYAMFGFTGTPILAQNAVVEGGVPVTTERVFGKQLHTYNITNAINDKKVLPFKVDYIKTMEEKEDIKDSQVYDIDKERILAAPERLSLITDYIIGHYDQKTGKKRFNSILACQNIRLAIEYYKLLKEKSGLKVAMIYSFSQNEELSTDGIDEEELDETALVGMDKSSRDSLDEAIGDYNKTFSQNFDTSAEKFQNYYEDLSQRFKRKEIDILIVVNMFLTGFDAVDMNTLWVDKNLRYHGLLQAFSRTNRIKNSIKTHGNIVCFRNLQTRVDEAISLFGDSRSSGIVLLKGFESYYSEYQKSIIELKEKYPLESFHSSIIGESSRRKFIQIFGSAIKHENILGTFDRFEGKSLLTEGERQNYQSHYLDIRDEFAKLRSAGKEDVTDDIVFETELMKSISVDVDYILELIRKYHKDNSKSVLLYDKIMDTVLGSVFLRSKKELIESFIKNIEPEKKIDDIAGRWERFYVDSKESDLKKICEEMDLYYEKTNHFLLESFKNGSINFSGTILNDIMRSKQSFFNFTESSQKESIKRKLLVYFERYKLEKSA